MLAACGAAQVVRSTYIVKSFTKGTQRRSHFLRLCCPSPQLAPVFELLSGMPRLGDPGSGKGTIAAAGSVGTTVPGLRSLAIPWAWRTAFAMIWSARSF